MRAIAAKARISTALAQNEAEQAFFNEPILLISDNSAQPHRNPLQCTCAIPITDRFLHVTFILRDQGRLIRLISARDMNRKERMRYEQEA